MSQSEDLQNLHLLCGIQIMTWIPFKRVTELLRSLEVRKCKKNELIIEKGAPANDFYIIKSGYCLIESEEPSFKLNKVIGRGDYFGESCLIPFKERLTNVTALTNNELLVISRVDFEWDF